jgi:hypothetical protein
MRRCCDERPCRASTGAEIADMQIASLGMLSDPGSRHQQASREQLNIENIAPVARLVVGRNIWSARQ